MSRLQGELIQRVEQAGQVVGLRAIETLVCTGYLGLLATRKQLLQRIVLIDGFSIIGVTLTLFQRMRTIAVIRR